MQPLLKRFAVLVLGVSAAASAGATEAFAVSARLTHAGQVFAEPGAVVVSGQPARIDVAGPDGYTLTLTVSEMSADQIRVIADLQSSRGAMAPTVVVHPGQPATVSIGDLALELTVRKASD